MDGRTGPLFLISKKALPSHGLWELEGASQGLVAPEGFSHPLSFCSPCRDLSNNQIDPRGTEPKGYLWAAWGTQENSEREEEPWNAFGRRPYAVPPASPESWGTSSGSWKEGRLGGLRWSLCTKRQSEFSAPLHGVGIQRARCSGLAPGDFSLR